MRFSTGFARMTRLPLRARMHARARTCASGHGHDRRQLIKGKRASAIVRAIFANLQNSAETYRNVPSGEICKTNPFRAGALATDGRAKRCAGESGEEEEGPLGLRRAVPG